MRHFKNVVTVALLVPVFTLAPMANRLASAVNTCGTAGVMSSTATSVSCTYSYTGSSDTFSTPAGVSSISVSVYGAQGGTATDLNSTSAPGGKGAEVTATLSGVSALTIAVGSAGSVSDGGTNPYSAYFGGAGGSSGASFGGHAGGGGAASQVVFSSGRIIAAGGGGAGSDAPGSDGFGPTAGGAGGDGTSGANGGNGGEACCGTYDVNGGGGGNGATSSAPGAGGTAGSVVTSLGTNQAGSVGSDGHAYLASFTGDGGDGAGGPNSGGDGGGGDGGGGGGGYNGGGGGGSGADTFGMGFQAGGAGGGGGGGVSYASGTGTPTYTAGTESGNGKVVVSYFETLTTTPSSTSVSLPTSTPLKDSALLAGGLNPTGMITFTLVNPNDAVVDTETVPVSGDGTYTTPTGYTLTTGSASGTYQWDATFTPTTGVGTISDDNDPTEQVTVIAVRPTLATTPSPASVDLPTSPPLKDSVLVSGGSDPTGTITFTLYDPNFNLVDTETVTVSGDGTYTTPTGYTLPTTGSVTGTYQWDASYSGDTNNGKVSEDDDPSEQVTVNSASPTLTTTPEPTSVNLPKLTTLKDSAVLLGGFNPGGTITFTLYDPNSNVVDSETVSVHGNGTYATPTGYTPTTGSVLGGYQWDASYSGDPNNDPVSDDNNPNELVDVRLSTEFRAQATLSSRFAVTLSASLTSGGVGLPGQLIVFKVGNESCDATTNGNGQISCTFDVPIMVLLRGASYTASYGGDTEYAPSSASGDVGLGAFG